MSQLRKENIECPHCHQEGEFDLWTSVNVDLNPELREKVFSDELFYVLLSSLWQSDRSTCWNSLS